MNVPEQYYSSFILLVLKEIPEETLKTCRNLLMCLKGVNKDAYMFG